MRRLVVVVLAACHAQPSPPPSPPNPGPAVDAQCVEQARRGTLIQSMPHEVSGFAVTPTKDGVYLRRAGRAITAHEGEAVFKNFATEQFDRGAYGAASPGTCQDVADPGCLSVIAWICQRDLAFVADSVLASAASANASDAELGLQVSFYESAGPPCKGESCRPAPHYSTANAVYHRFRGRHRLDDRSVGRCTRDADCTSNDSNWCKAWYLRGGGEQDLLIMYPKPTFCGCVENVCSWFQQ